MKNAERLSGVHPDLIKIVELADTLTEQPFGVLCGVRTQKEQAELYARGRTKPGPKVTWTMQSKHLVQEDGLGHAVDLITDPVDWNDIAKWKAIVMAMKKASWKLNIAIRCGADWDRDGVIGEKGESDWGHFELYP